MKAKETAAAGDKGVIKALVASSGNLRPSREIASRFATLGMLALGRRQSG